MLDDATSGGHPDDGGHPTSLTAELHGVQLDWGGDVVAEVVGQGVDPARAVDVHVANRRDAVGFEDQWGRQRIRVVQGELPALDGAMATRRSEPRAVIAERTHGFNVAHLSNQWAKRILVIEHTMQVLIAGADGNDRPALLRPVIRSIESLPTSDDQPEQHHGLVRLATADGIPGVAPLGATIVPENRIRLCADIAADRGPDDEALHIDVLEQDAA